MAALVRMEVFWLSPSACRFRGGGVPYGYRLAPSGILNKRKHEVCKLEINEDEARKKYSRTA